MRTCTVCLLLALALALVLVVDASLEDTCKVAAGSSPGVTYDFCVSALKSDPASGSADNKGLAIIAASLSAANATKTEAKLKGLLVGRPEDKTKACLDTCLELYAATAVPALSGSLDELRSSRYADAKAHLSAAIAALDDCRNVFDDVGVPSLLSAEDAALQLSTIAYAITSML